MAISLYGFMTGRIAQGGYTIGFAIVFSLMLLVGSRARFHPRKSGGRNLENVKTDSGATSLKIPYSAVTIFGGRLIVAATATLLTVAAIHASTLEDPGLTGTEYIWGTIAIALWTIFIIAVKYGRGFLLLSSEGITHHGGSFWSFLPWAGIETLEPILGDGPEILIMSYDDTPWHNERLARIPGMEKPPRIPSGDNQGVKPTIHLRCVYFDVDPALILSLLSFYARNPNARHELNDGSAINRAREATLS
jgi:hypothetical protein